MNDGSPHSEWRRTMLPTTAPCSMQGRDIAPRATLVRPSDAQLNCLTGKAGQWWWRMAGKTLGRLTDCAASRRPISTKSALAILQRYDRRRPAFQSSRRPKTRRATQDLTYPRYMNPSNHRRRTTCLEERRMKFPRADQTNRLRPILRLMRRRIGDPTQSCFPAMQKRLGPILSTRSGPPFGSAPVC